MRRSDDHVEHLISRKLDGELTDDESLDLDKFLIRDPAARQSLEESERIDCMTAALLDEVCAVPDEVLLPEVNQTSTRHPMRWFGAFPAAAAACVALFFMWPMFSPLPPDSDDPTADSRVASAPVERDPFAGAVDPAPRKTSARLASHPDQPAKLRPLREHSTRLNYYGVLDPETQKLYLLEVKRETGTQRPNQLRQRGLGRGGVRLASHEM